MDQPATPVAPAAPPISAASPTINPELVKYRKQMRLFVFSGSIAIVVYLLFQFLSRSDRTELFLNSAWWLVGLVFVALVSHLSTKKLKPQAEKWRESVDIILGIIVTLFSSAGLLVGLFIVLLFGGFVRLF